MSGSGNLLLKQKVGSAAANDGGIPNTGVLLEGMPAVQLVGLPPAIETANGSGLYPGHSLANVSNRLWIGMGRTAWSEIGQGGVGWAPNETGPSIGITYGGNITQQSATRPIWMGAEIRAQTPLVKGGANPTSSNALTYTILKASWDETTNNYLNSFDPTEAGRGTVYASDTVLVTQRATYNYVEGRITETFGGFAATLNYILKVVALENDQLNDTIVTLGWSSLTANFNEYLSATSGANVALLGSDGATKGPQTFSSPIIIEQKLTVNGYTIDYISYPATIYSDNTEASIFDENITTLSIGGSASTITLGDASTSGSTITTIYGSTIINGSLQATEIDGGSF